MNFDYQIINNQLFLSPSSEEAEFHFLEIGFTQKKNPLLKHLSEMLKDLDEVNALKLLKLEAARYPNSSLFSELKKLNSSFVFSDSSELIFFGGSFNPWHRGHKACLELMGTKPIIVLPDRNPFKELLNVSPVEIYSQLIGELNLDHHYLNPEFIIKEEKNPTYTWIKTTRDRYPNATLSLLMGMDSLDSIERWFEADKLLKTINVIYAASRNEDIAKRAEIHHRLSKYSHLHIVFLGHHLFEDESSTKLRCGK